MFANEKPLNRFEVSAIISPAIYEWREFAEAGGLMSYGTNLVEAYRLQGVYAGPSSRARSR